MKKGNYTSDKASDYFFRMLEEIEKMKKDGKMETFEIGEEGSVVQTYNEIDKTWFISIANCGRIIKKYQRRNKLSRKDAEGAYKATMEDYDETK